jgi:hypothetical protein
MLLEERKKERKKQRKKKKKKNVTVAQSVADDKKWKGYKCQDGISVLLTTVTTSFNRSFIT